ncbi:hypothetical protein [Latilactobacillus sakei]|uniref:hypothetical protein n=1 Tax=Latilactobacillus sakei TaxID=1599 RepID=UPI003F52F73B
MGQNVDYKALHPSYKALWDLVGEENMLKIYEEFRGTQLQLPMRLYERNALESVLRSKDQESLDIKELSKQYGFSPRWIRQIIMGEVSDQKDHKMNN